MSPHIATVNILFVRCLHDACFSVYRSFVSCVLRPCLLLAHLRQPLQSERMVGTLVWCTALIKPSWYCVHKKELLHPCFSTFTHTIVSWKNTHWLVPFPAPPPTLECKCCNHEGRESLVSFLVSGIKSGKKNLTSGPFPISSCSCVRNGALPEFTVFVQSLRMTLNLTCSPRVDDTFSNVSPLIRKKITQLFLSIRSNMLNFHKFTTLAQSSWADSRW